MEALPFHRVCRPSEDPPVDCKLPHLHCTVQVDGGSLQSMSERSAVGKRSDNSELAHKIMSRHRPVYSAKSKLIKTKLPQSASVKKHHPLKRKSDEDNNHKPSSSKGEEVLRLLKEDWFTFSNIQGVVEDYRVQLSRNDVSSILTALQQQHDWQRSLQLFQLIKRQPWYSPNPRLYARLIGFLGKEGQLDLAIFLFQEMLLEKCKPTQYTLTATLSAYGKAKMYEEANSVFEYMRASKDPECKPNTVSCNALMDCLVKGGLHDQAMKIYSDMREGRNMLNVSCKPNTVTYNILLESLCKEGLIDSAVQVLQQINKDSDQEVLPNVYFYNLVINACGRAGLPFKAEELMEEMVEKGLEPDKITYTGLIDAYGKAGLYVNAENAFQGMRAANIEVDVMAYTAMLDAYASEGLYEKAEGLFETMQQAGVQPNHVTYCALIDAYGKSGLPDEASSVFAAMQRAGYKGNVYIYSALIDAYGKNGKYNNAAEAFKSMGQAGCRPNLIVYAALLSACKRCVCWEDASLLLDCLQQSGRHEGLAIHRLLMASDEVETWENALRMFREIQEQPHKARQSFYNSLMDVLWSFGLRKSAAAVLAIGRDCKVYSNDFGTFSEYEWCLDLHALSVGAAMVVLTGWLDELHVAWLWGEGVPDLIRIVTGKGKHSRSKKSALKATILHHLTQIKAPFASINSNTGCLAASGEQVRNWLFSAGVKKCLQLTDIENPCPGAIRSSHDGVE